VARLSGCSARRVQQRRHQRPANGAAATLKLQYPSKGSKLAGGVYCVRRRSRMAACRAACVSHRGIIARRRRRRNAALDRRPGIAFGVAANGNIMRASQTSGKLRFSALLPSRSASAALNGCRGTRLLAAGDVFVTPLRAT